MSEMMKIKIPVYLKVAVLLSGYTVLSWVVLGFGAAANNLILAFGAPIIFGAAIDENLVDQVKVTVVATGFDETRRHYVQITQTAQDLETKEVTEGEEVPSDQIDETDIDIPTFLRQIR